MHVAPPSPPAGSALVLFVDRPDERRPCAGDVAQRPNRGPKR